MRRNYNRDAQVRGQSGTPDNPAAGREKKGSDDGKDVGEVEATKEVKAQRGPPGTPARGVEKQGRDDRKDVGEGGATKASNSPSNATSPKLRRFWKRPKNTQVEEV